MRQRTLTIFPQGKAAEAARDKEVRLARESKCVVVSPQWITAVSSAAGDHTHPGGRGMMHYVLDVCLSHTHAHTHTHTHTRTHTHTHTPTHPHTHTHTRTRTPTHTHTPPHTPTHTHTHTTHTHTHTHNTHTHTHTVCRVWDSSGGEGLPSHVQPQYGTGR